MWKDICWKESLDREGEPVLELELAVPLPVEEDRGAVRMGRWCARLGAVWYRRWAGAFYQSACAAWTEARAQARPFRPWEAGLTWKLTREDDKVCSLWLEGRERRGGGETRTVRTAMTWTRRDGLPRTLAQCFPASEPWREEVLEQIRSQLEERRREGVFLARDAGDRAAVRFDPSRFFLADTGPVLYYPMGALGPVSSGILEFALDENLGTDRSNGQKNPGKA